MNYIYHIRLLLLLTFAVLQGLAPLAHAHVNGDNEAQHVHLSTFHISDGHFHDGLTTQFSADESHSAIVSMPLGNRVAWDVVVLADYSSSLILPVVTKFTSPLLIVEKACLPHIPYQHPLSQAPPFRQS